MSRDDKSASGFKIGRRQLLKHSTAIVAAAAIGPVTLLSGRTANAVGAGFSHAYFSEQVGAFFQIDAGAGGWNSLELVEVVGSDASPLLDQFTVRFRGSPNVTFEEGVYAVAPPAGDTFELHVQPSGSDGGGAYYDASFALMKPVMPSCAPPA